MKFIATLTAIRPMEAAPTNIKMTQRTLLLHGSFYGLTR
jgi:hypothetical protein